ncbi:MAG: hypothetical protein CMG00_01655, partial [Candidatus Marinimicrobia bacterium]|nr:hypothetical protein [Candidatus Neomarinimicrobiota bacterium]
MSNLISERITDLVPKRIYDEYTTRDDLQKLFNLNNFIGIINFYLWWKEYAEIKEYNYYWLPSIELSEKLFTSKLKNGIYSAHISIANRFKSKNECKKILSKGIISNIDYKKFKDWLRDSYYDVLPNNSYIFSDLSDLGKENLINNSKTKFISYKSNEYLIISDYLS